MVGRGVWAHGVALTLGRHVLTHLGGVVVQLEGQHHGPIDVDLLGTINSLRAHFQARACTLPRELGALRSQGDEQI